MTVTVKLFAWLSDCAGVSVCRVTLPELTCASDATRALAVRYPALGTKLAQVRPAVNLSYASWDTVLHDGDELALIPPVSGG